METEFDSESTSQILAYAIPIRYTSNNVTEISQLNPKVLDSVADRWIRNYQSGYLKSIEPLNVEDNDTEGFRAEIETYRRQIIIALDRDAIRQINNSNFDQAAHRLSQILLLSEISKFNGPQVASFGSSAQLHALTTLESVRPKLSIKALDEVSKAISQIQPNPERIRSIAIRLSTFSTVEVSKDGAQLPTPSQVAMMMTSNPNNYNIAGRVNTKGIILAESYRIAFQEEQKVEEMVRPYGLTASRMNSEVKSGLQ
ncbi:MAG: hypothetical protein ACKVQS_12600 [Fimbriimonadaceae bacterium]